MKKAVFALFCLLLQSAPMVQAQFTYTNADGSVYAYDTNKDGSANITSYAGPPWAVTIPTNIAGLTVGSIWSGAFYNTNQLLVSVSIPGCVSNIGNEAFISCTSLTNVAIANGVINLGLAAFNMCTSLTNVTIPGSVTRTGTSSFDGCTSLTSVTIAKGVTIIDDTSFASCTSLTNVTIGNTVTDIEYEAFFYCTNLTNIIIPGSVTSIEEDAFLGCHRLTGVYFAGNAPAIGAGAFQVFTNAMAYYLPGTTGWGDFSTNTGLATVLWNPLIQTSSPSFGVSNNQFGFNITGTTNIPVAVLACANLANPFWSPVTNISLTNGSYYFSEPLQSNGVSRFYGLGFP